jgi:succinate dehydrogenase / fumarate reductase flavoprotein subunit
MYHQFKELAGVDITKEPMEVGPTTHYIMGGVQVDADSQMTTIPGLFAAGECAAGLHGANRLGGNSLSDLLVFGQRAGEYAARYAKETGSAVINEAEVQEVSAWALAPFQRAQSSGHENPFQIQAELQEEMQRLVGIVRVEEELAEAIEKIKAFDQRAQLAGCGGNRGYNPGWHTAIELKHMLTVAEAIARAAKERKESRGGHFREDFQAKSDVYAKVNIRVKKDGDGNMMVEQIAKPSIREDLQQVIDEMK